MKTSHIFKFKILNGNVSNAGNLIPIDLSFEGFAQNLRKLSISNKSPKDFVESGYQSFVEALILYFGSEIGISDYENINSINHKYKAHGIGSRNGKVVTTFFAFNGKEFLTDGNSQLTEYLAQSCYLDGFDLNTNERIFNIFSDSVSIHENTIKNFVRTNQAQFYGINEIKQLVDGNNGFWKAYKESLENAVNEVLSCSMDFVPDSYQVESIKSLLSKKQGRYQVIWPTGTGKNEIMMKYSIELSGEVLKYKPHSKILFVAPRITLGKQGIKKIINRLKQHGIDDVTVVNFTSGDYDNDNLARLNCGVEEVVNTTNIEELNKAVNEAKGLTLIFTTYHSVYKIIESGMKFDLVNCDEAHNIVKGRSIPQKSRESVISDEAKSLSPLTVFYTATQALSGTPDAPVVDGKGMDNPELFGEIVSRKTPKEMIELGKIVRPILCHLAITKAVLRKHVDIATATQEEITRNAELNAYIIWESWKEIDRINMKHSVDSKANGVKMLVRCSGGKSYSEAIKSKTFKKYQKELPDVAIYAISSDWDVYRNGVPYPSNAHNINQFMEDLANKECDEKAIILHIAMVGEGWDVSGINAILPFGDMSDITSSQALGRGMRLHPFDRERLSKGLIVPSDCYKGKFFKPFCYVIMPKYCGFSDINRNNIERMVDQIQSDIGYCPYEIFNEESYDGKMITVPPPRVEKTYVVPEEIEHEFNIILSIEERKRQEEFRKDVEDEKEALLKQFANEVDK